MKEQKISKRGRTFTGTVISAKMTQTATVEWTRKVKVPKYERYTKKRSRVKAHNPDEIKAEEGDIVVIKESRPLSKTKKFIIIEKLGKEKGFAQKMEALEEGKKREKEETREQPEEKEEAKEE